MNRSTSQGFAAHGVVVVGAAALFLAYAPNVHAELGQPPAANSVPSTPPRVDIIVVGEGQSLDALPDKIASWFGTSNQLVRPYRVQRLDPRSVLTTSTRSGMCVWVFVENGGLVRLYFSLQEQPGQPARYLTNEIVLLRGLDELGLEQVSQVAYLSTMALWEGRLETSRGDVERQLGANSAPSALPTATTDAVVVLAPAQTAEPKRSVQASLRVRTGLAYGYRWRGAERSAQGPAVTLSATSHRGTTEIGARFQAQLLAPQELNGNDIDLRVSGYAPAAGLTMALGLTRQLFASAEIGLGLDIVRRETVRVSDEYLQPNSNAWDVRPICYTSLGVRGAFGRVGLAIAGTLVLQWTRVHYDVLQASGTQELFVPWRVQPGGFVGIDWF